MEKNTGYTITRAILYDNGRGFVLGENPEAPSPFVTWQFTEEQGKRDYYWGRYFGTEESAVKNFLARTSDYERQFGVKRISEGYLCDTKAQEGKPPIAEQVKAAEKLAGEKRGQPAPKKDSPDKGSR